MRPNLVIEQPARRPLLPGGTGCTPGSAAASGWVNEARPAALRRPGAGSSGTKKWQLESDGQYYSTPAPPPQSTGAMARLSQRAGFRASRSRLDVEAAAHACLGEAWGN